MNIGTQPLVEKYRPKIMKQIIGQQGDKSCANNLRIWLRDWHKNRQDPKFKDGSMFKICILHIFYHCSLYQRLFLLYFLNKHCYI